MQIPLEGKQYLIFKISGRFFAVSIKDVERIISIDFVCKVPLSRPYFDGLVRMDERAIPVFNIGAALGFKAGPAVSDSVVAVEHMQGSDVGLLVSDVVTVARIAPVDILDCESDFPGVSQKAKWKNEEVYMLLAEQLVFGPECG